MKRLFYLLFALPLMMMASCSDDDQQLPELSLNIGMTGQSEIADNGVIVVPQGNTFTIDSIVAKTDVKDLLLGGATYYWDYVYQGSTLVVPFTMSFNTSVLPMGNHLLQIYIPVFAVNYSPAEARVSYTVKIVAPQASDSTATPTPSTVTTTPIMAAK